MIEKSQVRRASHFLTTLGCVAVVMVQVFLASSAPFIPASDNQVLERLRTTPLTAADRELRALRLQNRQHPADLAVALEVARRLIEKSRAEADPRHLGYAEAALAHWWNESQPPVDVLLLRATIKQSQHDFTTALADLDRALQLAPRNAQAWLTRATILTVLGRYAEARRACFSLAQVAPGLVALTATVSVTCLHGESERGLILLRSAMAGNPAAGVTEKLWALTVMGEVATRQGQTADAEEYFKRALVLGRRDPYLLGAYADFLLDQGRALEAANLLENETRADGLLLRLALAQSALSPRPVDFDAHLATLRSRFEAGHLRGETVHQREEARFTLHLLNEPQPALRFAQANWLVQREPADARILLEAALAARDSIAARPALDFIRTNRLEDVALTRLAGQLHGSAIP